MTPESLAPYRRSLKSIYEIEEEAPKWVLPGFLPPGLVVLFGDPKTFKSRIALHMIAAVTDLVSMPGEPRSVASRKGSAVYWAAEQSMRRLKYIYQAHVIRRKLPKIIRGATPMDFLMVDDPWEWQLDDPKPEHNLAEFMEEVRPTVAIIDPWLYFHSLDENDPAAIKPLIPLRKAALRYGSTIVVVHHANKSKALDRNGAASTGPDWGKMRGTSALWGMADGGMQTVRTGSGTVSVHMEFKDFPGRTWIFRPGTDTPKPKQTGGINHGNRPK